MNERLRKLLEQRASLWEGELKPLVTIEGRSLTVDERTKIDAIDERMKKLDEDIADTERALAYEKSAADARSRADGLGTGGGGTGTAGDDKDGKPAESRHQADTAEYRDAFNAWARGGMRDVSPEQRAILQKCAVESRALGTAPGAAGGFTIPQGFYRELTVAMKAYGGMVPMSLGLELGGGATDGDDMAGTTLIETETGNDLPFPTMNDTNNAGARLAENTVITQQDVTFGQVVLKAYTYTSKLILVPWALLQDSAFDMPRYISAAAGERLGRVLNTELTTGAGSGSAMPMGVLTAATVGKTLASPTATPTYDDLIDLQHSVNRAYRRGGKYMFSDASLVVLRKLKDTQNRPLWEPTLQAGAPSIFAGKPYVVNDDMPAIGSGNKSLLFGDFSTYKVRIARDMSLIRLDERYADALQSGFFVWMRADGNLVDGGGQAIKALANP